MNILIVESNAESAASLLSLVEEYYRPASAGTHIDEAKERILNDHISLVIVNWSLPEESAKALCKWMREDNVDRYVYVLGVVDESDPIAQVEALKAGADDVIDEPISTEQLRARLNCAQRVLNYHSILLKRTHRLEATFDHLMQDFMEVTTDLADASRVQKSLLPTPGSYQNIRAHGMLRPATQLSGDSFDYFILNDDFLAFYIADAVGHGSASAMVSYALHHQIKPRVQGICHSSLINSDSEETAVINTVTLLNEQFVAGEAEANRWFTMIYGLIELSSGQVTLCQAGQPPALHCAGDGARVVDLGGGGFPVGLFEDANYTTDKCVLEPGDKLLLCSDGAIECKSPSEEEFGVTNLKHALQDCAGLNLQETAVALTEKLVAWNGDEVFDDDLSLLLFQCAA